MKKTALPALLFVMTALAVAMFAGCGGGNNAPAPAGPVIMAVIPSSGGVDANNIYGTHWSGDHGKYRFRLVRGIGEVVSEGGVSPTPTPSVRYGFIVDQVTGPADAHPGSFIGNIAPDSDGVYSLVPWGVYHITAGEVGVLDFSTVAECQLAIRAPAVK